MGESARVKAMKPLFRVIPIFAMLAVAIFLAGCCSPEERTLAAQRCVDTLSYCPRMLELDVTP